MKLPANSADVNKVRALVLQRIGYSELHRSLMAGCWLSTVEDLAQEHLEDTSSVGRLLWVYQSKEKPWRRAVISGFDEDGRYQIIIPMRMAAVYTTVWIPAG